MKAQAQAQDKAFAALADGTRRALVRALVQQPRRAGELAELLGVSPPALSRHLRVLRHAGFVQEEGLAEDARVRIYRLAPRALDPVRGWLDQVEAAWAEQLASFKQFAEAKRRAR